MKPGKLPNMVAVASKPKMGRPPKFPANSPRTFVQIAGDLHEAAQLFADRRKIPFTDAIRELMRCGAEAHHVIEPRK